MSEEQLEELREKTRLLCAERGLAIIPYGNAWWIIGQGVDCVVTDLAGVSPQHLEPLPIMER